MAAAKMKTLFMILKGEYLNAIEKGEKKEEYRRINDFWKKKIIGRHYDKIIFQKGYRKDKRIEVEYLGFTIKTIQHKHFGENPVQVFALLLGNVLFSPGFRLNPRGNLGEVKLLHTTEHKQP